MVELAMKWWLLAVVSTALLGPVSIVAAADPREGRRVRPLDRWADETVDRGLTRSALVRELVEVLEQSDLIVHVQTITTLPAGIAGQTRLTGDAGVSRYVRVQLDRHLSPDERASVLAHELHHAVEIARSAARDDDGVRELYERIGQTAGSRRVFETSAAREAGMRAWYELRGLRVPARTRIDSRR
jgi:hypothetical protein